MRNLKAISAVMAAAMTISALGLTALADEPGNEIITENDRSVIEAVLDEDTEVTLNETNDTATLFTGAAITSAITLYSNGTRLIQDTDYTLDYDGNINVGQAKITITFIGNYSGTRTIYFNIIARELAQSDITITGISSDPYTYTGSAVTPKPTIQTSDGTTLTENTDYTLDYDDNVDVGTATITISFKGNYSGEAETTFRIGAQELDMDGVNISATADQTYTGSEIKPEPTVRYGSLVLVKDRDYELTYENNTNVGTATINVTLINNYSGEKSSTFKIIAKNIAEGKIQTGDPQSGDEEAGIIRVETISDKEYTGSQITPQPGINFGDTTLVEGRDYDLTYSNNINAGTATVTVTLKGNYSGSGDINFTIKPKTVTDTNVTISTITDQTYTGSAITPEPDVTDNDR